MAKDKDKKHKRDKKRKRDTDERSREEAEKLVRCSLLQCSAASCKHQWLTVCAADRLPRWPST